MIADKGLPALGRRVSSPDHIVGNARLSDIDAELEKLSMDPRRSPQWVCNAHPSDQPPYFERHRWSTATRSRLPAPVRSEPSAVPTDNGVRLNDRQRIANFRKQSIEPTNINRSIALKTNFLGAVRRRMFICCRNVQTSASSAARDRIRSTTIHPMSLQRSLITRQHCPILDQLPACVYRKLYPS